MRGFLLVVVGVVSIGLPALARSQCTAGGTTCTEQTNYPYFKDCFSEQAKSETGYPIVSGVETGAVCIKINKITRNPQEDLEKFPLNAVMFAEVAVSGNVATPSQPRFTLSYEVSQTHEAFQGAYAPLASARGVRSVSNGGSSLSGYPMQEIYNWAFRSGSIQSERTGKYKVHLYVTKVGGIGNGTIRDELIVEVSVPYLSYWQGDTSYGNPGGNGSGGEGGEPGEGGNSPDEDEQRGFWESLFVPTSESVEDLREAAGQFAGWGPSGMLQDAIAALDDDEAGMSAAADLPMALLPGGSPSSTHVDLGWASPVFGGLRVCLAFIVWFGVLYGGWQFVIKFMLG